ncbi:cytochrome P450 [Lasiosphaeris hirsuta]|uniref:Cytochrome P450 n=1 Tax=Lasiosphaeris hirsuta TaxID=260670 RepID=A0AA39ZPQ9_9PEZI|nr:cytochrome P450 [Lasiosphaeris hirsuta]
MVAVSSSFVVVVQIFMTPFGRPWVLVSDFWEAQDIMMRRTREFDKSSLTKDSFSALLPNYQHNRELVKDLMTPAFLDQVSAPEIYDKLVSLLGLWSAKAESAVGRPFHTALDLYFMALDITMAITFDFPQSDTIIPKQLVAVQSTTTSHAATPEPEDGQELEPVIFPSAPLDPELQALVFLTESINVAFQSPLPYPALWLYLQKPSSRRALRLKEQLIRRNIERALARIEVPDTREKLRCAVDQILLREMATAESRGAQPDFHKGAIYDEFMSRSQQVQTRLRSDLHAAHAAALSEARLPTASEIVRAHIPYLDAVMEETLRHSHIVPMQPREALVDTQILGHAIPKGTHVILVNNAASFMQPAFEVAGARRTKASRRAKSRCEAWNPADIGEFKPERWLRKETGNGATGYAGALREVFDIQAGLQLPFGAGPRSCFGRRLAYLSMRVAFTLLIWNFEFLEIHGELSSFEAEDSSTEAPRSCYVKLRKIGP